MDKSAKYAIASAITPAVIAKATRRIAQRYNQEIAEEAVSTALLRMCQHYDPHHPSGASPITYFNETVDRIVAELHAKHCKYEAHCPNEIRLDDTVSGDDDTPQYETIADPLSDVDVDHLDLETPTWLNTLPIVDATLKQLTAMMQDKKTRPDQYSKIKLAKRVMGLMVELVEQECDWGHGSRKRMYSILAERLGVSWRSVHNAMSYIRRAVQVAQPDLCRQWAYL